MGWAAFLVGNVTVCVCKATSASTPLRGLWSMCSSFWSSLSVARHVRRWIQPSILSRLPGHVDGGHVVDGCHRLVNTCDTFLSVLLLFWYIPDLILQPVIFLDPPPMPRYPKIWECTPYIQYFVAANSTHDVLHVIKPPLATARAASCIGPLHLYVCLSVCRQIAKTRFSQKLSNLEPCVYWRPIGSRTWAFQRTHYWTPNIQDGWSPPSWILTPKCKNVIFSKN